MTYGAWLNWMMEELGEDGFHAAVCLNGNPDKDPTCSLSSITLMYSPGARLWRQVMGNDKTINFDEFLHLLRLMNDNAK